MFQTTFYQMIKPGYSLVVPARGTSTYQGLVTPSRRSKNNQGLVAPLTPYAYPIDPFYSLSGPHRPAPRGWRPAIQLDSELN